MHPGCVSTFFLKMTEGLSARARLRRPGGRDQGTDDTKGEAKPAGGNGVQQTQQNGVAKILRLESQERESARKVLLIYGQCHNEPNEKKADRFNRFARIAGRHYASILRLCSALAQMKGLTASNAWESSSIVPFAYLYTNSLEPCDHPDSPPPRHTHHAHPMSIA